MTWTRLSDTFTESPRMLRVSRDARLFHIEAMVWCNRMLTDGKIPGKALRRISDTADINRMLAAQVVGDGLARDIARRIDQAAVAGLSAPAPAGLATLSGVSTYVNASAFANLDFAAEAISKAEVVGATITSFVADPATALALAKVKTGTGSNQPVLGVDATAPTSRSILGVPLFVSQYVAANTLRAIDSAGLWLVVRDDATVEADRSVYFTSDRVAVKATMRARLRLCAPGVGREGQHRVTWPPQGGHSTSSASTSAPGLLMDLLSPG